MGVWLSHERLRQAQIREHVMMTFIDNGIGCRPYSTPIHLKSFYTDQFGFKEGDFPNTEFADRTSIAIPFHSNLSKEEVEYVGEVLEGRAKRVAVELVLKVRGDSLILKGWLHGYDTMKVIQSGSQ